MSKFSTSAKTFEELDFEEQGVVALIELLTNIALGQETKARVDHVLSDLFMLTPWANLSRASVSSAVAKVATNGITSLPSYVREDYDGPEEPKSEVSKGK